MWWICWKPPVLGKIKEGHSAKSCKNILQQTTSHNFSDRSTAANFSGLLRIVRTSVMFFTMMENDLDLPTGNKSLTTFVSSKYFFIVQNMRIIRTYTYNIYSSLDMYNHMVICIIWARPPHPGRDHTMGGGSPGTGFIYIYIYIYVHIHMCVCML